LKGNQVVVFVLHADHVLFVVEQLLAKENELPLLEFVVVQRLFVQIAFSLVRAYDKNR
tara:strand:- start:663 stop:836 length:174 start_codon:yes stop_codon:yes gene_type:complete